MSADLVTAGIAIGLIILLWIVAARKDNVCPMCSGRGERLVLGNYVRCVICAGKGVLR